MSTLLGTTPAYADGSFYRTATPIKHIVVIFQENVSFDHYFGTYPHAMNPPGEPRFHADPGTPSVNGLKGALLISNPNLNPANGTGASNPFRLDRNQAATADQNHTYGPEQGAFDFRSNGSVSKIGRHCRSATKRSSAHRNHNRFDHGLL